MIAGLAAGLGDVAPVGADELAAALEDVLPPEPSLAAVEPLGSPRVRRLRFRAQGDTGADPTHSLVVKRLPLDCAHREERATRHWLPRVGLGTRGPPLLRAVVAKDASCVWHVYEDLGDDTLARLVGQPGRAENEAIDGALALLARLHLAFVAHPLLADCRLAGLELGSGFFASSVGDAGHGLAALRGLGPLPGAREALVERLLERLARLATEADARMREHTALRWPETLQHGDPWLVNFLRAAGPDPTLRLIDWDRAGVGAAVYDLSTFLRQLPGRQRPAALRSYGERVRAAGWRWPGSDELERVAETCELARFASCLAWRTLGVLEAGAPAPDWLFDDLTEIERWFTGRTPLLTGAQCR